MVGESQIRERNGWTMSRLKRKNDLENSYNWDETGLFFKLIPHSTYTAQNEARKTSSRNESIES